MFFQALEEFPPGRVGRDRLAHYDDVETGKPQLVSAERFPHDAFYSVASDGFFAVFLGNRKAESRQPEAVPAAQYGKPIVLTSRGTLEHPGKCRGIEQPVVFRKPLRRIEFQIV